MSFVSLGNVQKYGLSQQARETEQRRNGVMRNGMPGNLTRVHQYSDRYKDTSLALKSVGCARCVQGRRNVVVMGADGSSGNGGPSQDAEVQAVLFDMDGVLCNSEIVSRQAAAEVMKELYDLDVSPDEFAPFTGTGEANFLGGVARKYNAPFEVESCKAKFFEIYMAKYAVPGAGIGYKGARELVEACKAAGLKTAVASSADLIKVKANLAASDIPLEIFDTIVSADVFERLKPFPDIFLSAASNLGIDPQNCIVIEDAVAGIEAARAAGMRVIGVSTTLPEASLQAVAPDAMFSDISEISLETASQLKLRAGGMEAIKAAKQKIAEDIQQQTNSLGELSGQEIITVPTKGYEGGNQSKESIVSITNADNVSASINSWLDKSVSLPAGYQTTRRDTLKFLSLGGAVGSGWVAITRAKANSALVHLLLQLQGPILLQLGICIYVAFAWPYWSKSLSYVSPQAILNLFTANQIPSTIARQDRSKEERVASFKRFIADLESRGGGQAVPEFPMGAQWLNAPPLSLSKELRGKVLLLDFWTFCCINCMHILPDLDYLENKFQDDAFEVIGVHSAKFDAESDTDAIRNAIIRYDILHPVINDRKMEMWRDLGISSWPTLVAISPTGKVMLQLSGENHRRDLEDLITAALDYYGERGLLINSEVPKSLEKDKDPRLTASSLRYPGKIAIDDNGKHIFISDSGNHRIVIVNAANGKHVESIGGNGPGLLDGSFDTALFNRPQGLVFNSKNNRLYVCDTESHAVREVDFEARTVKTLAGNGSKGEDYQGGRRGTSQALNSPWDCCIVPSSEKDTLVVAMAGIHQLWSIDIDTGKAEVLSGTGNERNQNGSSPETTSWAQPSGLSVLRNKNPEIAADTIFVADSESSSIRKFDIKTKASFLCAGGDPLFSDNLFRFGDADGQGSKALLQHPLAVASSLDGKNVFVADSYNNKIKGVDTETCSVYTIAGNGKSGLKDGNGKEARFSEPGGLVVIPDGRILVADTNNSALRIVDPETKTVKTFVLEGVPSPRISPDSLNQPKKELDDLTTDIPGASLVIESVPLEESDGEIRLAIRLPKGYHLTPGANSRFECVSTLANINLSPRQGQLMEDSKGNITAVVQYSDIGEPGLIRILATIYYCQNRNVCLYQEIAFIVKLKPDRETGTSFGERRLQFELSSQAPSVNLNM